MFVRYFVELSLPVAAVERALVDSQPEWLSAMAGQAQARGDELLGQVGVGPWDHGSGGGSRSSWASRSGSRRWSRCR